MVCCIYRSQAPWFVDRKHNKGCSRQTPHPMRHTHVPLDEVIRLIAEGKAEWVGNGTRPTAMTTELAPVEWHKVKGAIGKGNAFVAAMQMLTGGEQRFPRMVIGGLVSPR